MRTTVEGAAPPPPARSWRDRTREPRLLPGFVTITAALLLAAGLVVAATWRAVDTARSAAAAEHVLRAVAGVLVEALNAETGCRGYLITGDLELLEPYRGAGDSARGHVARLRTLVAADAVQVERVRRLEALLEDRLLMLSRQIELRAREDFEPGTEVGRLKQGKARMDEIRAAVRGIEAAQLAVLEDRLAETERATTHGVLAFSLLTLFLLAALVVGFLQVKATLADREATETQIRILNDELAASAAEANALAEERDRVFTHSRDLIVVAGTDGYFKRVNPSWTRVFGWTTEEMSSRPYMEFVHPDDRAATVAAATALAGDRDVADFENRYLAKDGTWRILAWSAGLERPGGEVIFAFARDVTDARRAERELAEAHALLASVTGGTTDAVFAKDREGRYVFINAAGAAFLGLTPGTALGRTDAEILGREEAAALAATDRRILATGETATVEEEFRVGGTRRVFLSTKGVRRDADGAVVGLFGISRDITERKRMESDLRAARDAAEDANRELESFSYSVSHDLRAPLRGIHGFTQAILEDAGDTFTPEVADHFRRVQAAAARMGALIDDLLTLSRISRAAPAAEAVDLAAVSRDVFEELRAVEPARAVTLRVPETLPARGDPRLLRVVLANLVGNAWKFTSKKAEAVIEVGRSEEGGEEWFHVADDGAGFDPAYASRLFGAFQRLHPQSEFAGTGIGLATVARIIHRHGGRVRAEGAPGRGATFRFTLPVRGE